MAVVAIIAATAFMVGTSDESDAYSDTTRGALNEVYFVPNYTGNATGTDGVEPYYVYNGNEIQLPVTSITNPDTSKYLVGWCPGSIDAEPIAPGTKVEISEDTVYFAKWATGNGLFDEEAPSECSITEVYDYRVEAGALTSVEFDHGREYEWLEISYPASGHQSATFSGSPTKPGVYYIEWHEYTVMSGQHHWWVIYVPSDFDKVINFTYDSDGGSTITQPGFSLHAGTATILPGQGTTTKAGQILTGWVINDGANNFPLYALGSAYTAGSDLYDNLGGNITITAGWDSQTGVFILNASGAKGISATAVKEGDVIRFPDADEIDYDKPGYTLEGWYIGDDEDVIYAVDYIYQMGNVAFSSNVANAYWVKEGTSTFHVNYSPNGGNDYSLSQDVESGKAVALPRFGFTMEGHSFIGWSTQQSGGNLLLAGQRYPASGGITSNVDLYAQYAESGDGDDTVHTVVFDTYGGTGSFAVQSVPDGGNVQRPASEPERDGYVFMGWALSGLSTLWDFDTPVQNDLTLRALWEPHFTVTFNGNTVTLSIEPEFNSRGLSDIDWGDGSEVSKGQSLFASHTYEGDVSGRIIVTTISQSDPNVTWESSIPFTVEDGQGGTSGGTEDNEPDAVAMGAIRDNGDGTWTLDASGSTSGAQYIWKIGDSYYSGVSVTLAGLSPGTYSVNLQVVVSEYNTATWDGQFTVSEDDGIDWVLWACVIIVIVIIALFAVRMVL